jgi:hypothetical protein
VNSRAKGFIFCTFCTWKMSLLSIKKGLIEVNCIQVFNLGSPHDPFLVPFVLWFNFGLIFLIFQFWFHFCVNTFLDCFICLPNSIFIYSLIQFWAIIFLHPILDVFFPWTNSRLLPSFNFRFLFPWINSRLLYLLTYFWIAFIVQQLWIFISLMHLCSIALLLDPIFNYCFLDQPNLHYNLGWSFTIVHFN